MDIPFPRPRLVYRSMGRGPASQRIGAGAMDKAGVAADQTDSRTPTWSLIYVLRGRGVYRDRDGARYPLGPGWCFQRIPERRHSTELDASSGWREVFIDLDPELHRALARMQVLRVAPVAWRWGLTRERVQRFARLIDELEGAAEGALPALCLRVVDLAIEAQAAAGDAPAAADAIDEACRALAERPADRDDLRGWCRARGLDYERFRKAFQRRVGVPPGQYRIRRRIDRACALLQTSDLPIAAIAAELGYPSPYEFSAQFRARMGLPPSRYRAR